MGSKGAERYRLLIEEGVKDSELEYLREHLSEKGALDRWDAHYRAAYRTADDVAQHDFPPIRIEVYDHGRVWLADGAHRYLAAWKHGARRLLARVILWGPRGGVREDKVVTLALKGPSPLALKGAK